MPRPYLIVLLLLLFIITCALVACTGTPQGNAADGKRWYSLHRCNGCHGESGGGGKGPVLAGTDLSFRRFVGKLRAPNSEIMPTFTRKQLPDQDAADIYLWLQTIKR
jgi:mono/diheme cytochrome c family protein